MLHFILQLIARHVLVYCRIEYESIKPTFDRATNLVEYYPMFWKTAEGNDCGQIIATNVTPRSVSFAFRMRRPSGDIRSHQASDNILPDFSAGL